MAVVLCCTVIVASWAQAVNRDSLLQQIRSNDTADTVRILSLAHYSNILSSEDLDSSLLLANQALTLARKMHYPKGIGRALTQRGVYFKQKNDRAAALAIYDSAQRFAEQARDVMGVARIKSNTGLIFQEQGNYAKALANDFDALRVFEKNKIMVQVATCNLNIGIVYLNQNIYDKASDFLKKCLATADSIHEYRLGGLASGALGFIYGVRKEYDKAILFQEKSLELMQKTKDIHSTTYPYNSLAEVYLYLHQPEKAQPYLEKGLAIATDKGFRDRISDFRKTYAQYYYQLRDFNRAYQSASEAQTIAKAVNHLELYKNATEQKYLAEIKLGNSRDALTSYQLYESLKDSMQNEVARQQSLAKDFAFNEEKLKLENANLALRAEIQAEALRRTRLLLVGILILTSILLAMAVQYFKSAAKGKKMLLEIRNKNEEIQAQAEELARVKEEIQRIRENLKNK